MGGDARSPQHVQNSLDAGRITDVLPSNDAASAARDGIPPPLLSDLSVAGVVNGTQPDFDPARLRYAVRATEPAMEIAITATAAPELELVVAGVSARSGEVVRLPNAEPRTQLDVLVRNELDEEQVYTVVYLPGHFPQLEVTTSTPDASSDPLYVNLTQIGTAYFVAKLDNAGVPLFYREVPNRAFDFKRHPSGEMSYGLLTPDDPSGAVIVLLDQTFESVREQRTVGLQNTDFHEYHLLDDGNAIMMAYESTERDMTPFGGEPGQRVDDSVLQEIAPTGVVVFEWNSWGHLPWDESVHYTNYDYAHVNSISVAADGNWIVSARGLSQVIKLDRRSGEVMWRLGGVSSDFTFADDPLGGFCGQHTVTELENGNILLFDNGTICIPENEARGEQSRAVEYALDQSEGTAHVVWSYLQEGAFGTSQGSAQRLPNGNTLISWGFAAERLATEVDAAGQVVFEITARGDAGPFITYRAQRFEDAP